MNPEYYTRLGISPGTTFVAVRDAYYEQLSRWQPLLSHPTRGAEAQRVIDELDEAFEALSAQFDTGQGELSTPESTTVGAAAFARKINKDHCPNCGSAENPPNARFCISCQDQLFQVCPKCGTELPWHYENCHRCGANLEDERHRQEQERQRQVEEQERRERERRQAELRREQERQEAEQLYRDKNLAFLVTVIIVAGFLTIVLVLGNFRLFPAQKRLDKSIASLNGTVIQIGERTLPNSGTSIQMPGPVLLSPPEADSSETPEYFADIVSVSFSRQDILVNFEAVGAADLLHPRDSCLMVGKQPYGMDRIGPRGTELSIATRGHYAGSIMFPIELLRSDENINFDFLYGCMYESVNLFSRYEIIR